MKAIRGAAAETTKKQFSKSMGSQLHF